MSVCAFLLLLLLPFFSRLAVRRVLCFASNVLVTQNFASRVCVCVTDGAELEEEVKGE